MTGRIDQVDQELVTLGLLGDIGDVVFSQLKVHRDGGRLDGDTSVDLVLTVERGAGSTHDTTHSSYRVSKFSHFLECANKVGGNLPSISKPHITRLGTRDNTSLGDQRVGQGGFPVVDVGDDRHVSTW